MAPDLGQQQQRATEGPVERGHRGLVRPLSDRRGESATTSDDQGLDHLLSALVLLHVHKAQGQRVAGLHYQRVCGVPLDLGPEAQRRATEELGPEGVQVLVPLQPRRHQVGLHAPDRCLVYGMVPPGDHEGLGGKPFAVQRHNLQQGLQRCLPVAHLFLELAPQHQRALPHGAGGLGGQAERPFDVVEGLRESAALHIGLADRNPDAGGLETAGAVTLHRKRQRGLEQREGLLWQIADLGQEAAGAQQHVRHHCLAFGVLLRVGGQGHDVRQQLRDAVPSAAVAVPVSVQHLVDHHQRSLKVCGGQGLGQEGPHNGQHLRGSGHDRDDGGRAGQGVRGVREPLGGGVAGDPARVNLHEAPHGEDLHGRVQALGVGAALGGRRVQNGKAEGAEGTRLGGGRSASGIQRFWIQLKGRAAACDSSRIVRVLVVVALVAVGAAALPRKSELRWGAFDAVPRLVGLLREGHRLETWAGARG
mmetsp:Transcript_31587/g.51261  ORF Transcript_31587/g.51261 Transcript_31587/m.51261 type:complete len:476 (+) Transcript_31587:1835-3262(+)